RYWCSSGAPPGSSAREGAARTSRGFDEPSKPPGGGYVHESVRNDERYCRPRRGYRGQSVGPCRSAHRTTESDALVTIDSAGFVESPRSGAAHGAHRSFASAPCSTARIAPSDLLDCSKLPCCLARERLG